MSTFAAIDGERYEAISNSQRWLVSWHAPPVVPPGRNHGAAGICLTHEGLVVLISQDGERWGFPAGRPEAGETFEDTLRREVAEEACAEVLEARLLGFSQGECVEGHELRLVLVRSFWVARVALEEWVPRFEVRHRRLVAFDHAMPGLGLTGGLARIHARALMESEPVGFSR